LGFPPLGEMTVIAVLPSIKVHQSTRPVDGDSPT